ncbi:energy coupling factor transporter S component ThiW [Scopulibacillus daqui]|uniref:Energy coupling factor transporter S component ThiW n=1 Tax=Scopulibacillus daqui TaxID=1469162 RepID=A0ABS2Q0X2_9BACL|nr:energy coupling factor transporter S component ThiW [Scopulibacillus daqui]
MSVRKLTFSALFIAVGTLTSHIIYIPIGVSKITPVQHMINVLSAVILGPGYAVVNAFMISLLRNLLGTGSLLAFPGSMIGACLAGLLYFIAKKKIFAVFGEITGTGIIGALASFPIAKWLLGQNIAAFFFIVPFLLSTVCGSLIAWAVLAALEKNRSASKYFSMR